jgi:prepilin-type N-terminal cleavage/methylation domain-containing protein
LQAGVTLIEMLVVITIAAVLLGVAVPAFTGTLQSIRQRSALTLVVDDLNRAKGEAIKRNTRVLVCPSNTGATDCNATADWQTGWLVCVEDSASAGHCLAGTAASPNPVAIRPALNASLTLAKTVAGAADTSPIRFSANSTATVATLTLGGTWTGATNRVVNVAATGGITKQ